MAGAAVSTVGGRYRILEVLGQGGQGTVYKALDTRLGRLVALKVWTVSDTKRFESSESAQRRESGPADSRAVAGRFAALADIVKQLAHPGIVQIFDFGTADGVHYMAQQLVEGRSLSEILGERRVLELDRAIEIVCEVARALFHAHRRGIVHGDVKPSNILISRDGRALLSDFDVAQRSGQGSLTAAGTVLGTPRYLSPQQARGDPLDARSDIFALGAVLYECLTGVPAFSGDSVEDTIRRVVTATPRPIREINSAVPFAVELVVARSLEKDPGRRFPTAELFAHALMEAASCRGDEIPCGDSGAELTMEGRSDDELSAKRPSDDDSSDALTIGDESRAIQFPEKESPLAVPPTLARGSWVRLGQDPVIAVAVCVILLLLLSLLVTPPARYFPEPRAPWAILLGVMAGVLVICARIVLERRPTGAAERCPPEPAARPLPDLASRRPTMAAKRPPLDASTQESWPYDGPEVQSEIQFQFQREETARAWLVVLNGALRGRQFHLADTFVIGRSPQNDLCLSGDRYASRNHAKIQWEDNRLFLSDLQSRFGTFLNGLRVQRQELRDRDEIQIGSTALLFIDAVSPQEESHDARRRLRAFEEQWEELKNSARCD
jgi:serine/threonine protein kinase